MSGRAKESEYLTASEQQTQCINHRTRRTKRASERLVNDVSAAAAAADALSMHYPNYDMFALTVQIDTCGSLSIYLLNAANEHIGKMIDRFHLWLSFVLTRT